MHSKAPKNRESDQELPPEEVATTSEECGDEEGVVEENEQPTSDAANELDPLVAKRLEDLEKRAVEYQDHISRTREYVKMMESEIKDVRARADRDQQKAIDTKLGRFFTELLPISDNLKRSLKASEGKDDSFYQGVKMIHQQLEEFFKRSGLEKIAAEGKEFDPHVHQALLARDVEDPEQDGRVIEEIEAGYRFKDATIRPSQVVVGKLPE